MFSTWRDVYMSVLLAPNPSFASSFYLLTPIMVGCKDDPSNLSRALRSIPQSPTPDEQDSRLTHWLHALPQTLPLSAHTPTSTLDGQSCQARNPLSTARPQPIKHTYTLINAPSNKRKALADLEPSVPRKSARLEQKQRGSAHNMPTSPLKKKPAGKNAREGAKRGPENDEAKASVNCVVTRGRAQAKVLTASSSDKENRDGEQSAVTALPRFEDARTTTPLLPPVAGLVLQDPGSPPKRKPVSSRPSSPTKSTSTKGSKAPALLDKRERLMLLNPPVEFLTSAYLGELGKSIPSRVKSLWVDHIVSDDEGFIPQALKVRHMSSYPHVDAHVLCPSRHGFLNRHQTNRSRAFGHLALQAILGTPKVTMREYG